MIILALAPFLLALKLSDPKSGHEISVAQAGQKVNAEVRVGDVLKGEVCIVSWEGSSCYQVGQEHPETQHVNRTYLLRQSACFGAIMSYWNEDVKKWVEVRTPEKCVKVAGDND